jgi:hypothetical protein
MTPRTNLSDLPGKEAAIPVTTWSAPGTVADHDGLTEEE